VVASLIAAFMSTISTHLNWGSSYIVNDFYLRFINPKASDRKQVVIGQASTVVLMFFVAILALLLSNALQAFTILLQIGAGTGLLFILRWFWWRINPYSELTAMVVSFLVAVYFQLIQPLTGLAPMSAALQLVTGVIITTIAWILVTLFTQPSDIKTLVRFYNLVEPGGPGWKQMLEQAQTQGEKITAGQAKWDVPGGIIAMVMGCFSIYGLLFAAGYWLYGNLVPAIILTIIGLAASVLLFRFRKSLTVRG
jgi:Na+/proline symporter